MSGDSSSGQLVVRSYTPADAGAWDELVRRSRSAHFLFFRGYMDYHADRFRDSSLLIEDRSHIVAALPANRTGNIVVSHGGLTFGGLISDPGLGTQRTLAVFDAVLTHLADTAVGTLIYKPVPHIYHDTPCEQDLYALFRCGARLIRRDVSSALRPGRHPQLNRLRQRALREAQRAGLQIGQSLDFTEFMALAAATLEQRHGVRPVHTAAEIALLAGRFPSNITLTTARYDGDLVAGVLVYTTAVVAHAQLGVASERGKRLHALDAIYDHLITERYRDRRFFDFGISTVRDGQELNAGLTRNKESYGATAVAYDWYECDVVARFR